MAQLSLLLILTIAVSWVHDFHDRERIPSAKGMEEMPVTDISPPKQNVAMRLIFEYEGDQVRLISQQLVDIVITGSDISHAQHPGYYVDVRDAVGRPLARVPARDAFSGSHEIFPEQPSEPIRRIDVPSPRGAFTVVIPVPEDSNFVSIVRLRPTKLETPLQAGAATSAMRGDVQEIARFALRVSR